MSQPRSVYGALLALLLVVAGLFASPSSAAASPRPVQAACQGDISDVFHTSGGRIRFQGLVRCDFTADVISIEVRLLKFQGGGLIRRDFVDDDDSAFLGVEKRCSPGLYAGTLAADAYVGGKVVASVRMASDWYNITC